ncbi:MAG: M23 family metallopeptidase [Promethearchaeota archaeon]
MSKTDYFIHTLRIINDNTNQIQLNSMKMQLISNNQVVWQRIWNQKYLNIVSKQFSNGFSKRFMDPDINMIIIGRAQFWNQNKLIAGINLNHLDEIGLKIPKIEYNGPSIPDYLEIEVCITNLHENKTQSQEKVIKKLKIHANGSKNQYQLPLRGSWQYNRSYDWDFGHRESYSQEYAVDFQQYNPNFKIQEAKFQENTTFPQYNAPVYAAMSGKVLIVGDNFPENPTAGDILVKDLKKRADLISKYGFQRAVMGNHIMILHENNEATLYCHLIPHKMHVQEGDQVKVGQIIGYLGNSGFSDFPHLHFQVLENVDGNPFKGRGIPCQFNNILDDFGNPIKYLQINNQCISTFEK